MTSEEVLPVVLCFFNFFAMLCVLCFFLFPPSEHARRDFSVYFIRLQGSEESSPFGVKIMLFVVCC